MRRSPDAIHQKRRQLGPDHVDRKAVTHLAPLAATADLSARRLRRRGTSVPHRRQGATSGTNHRQTAAKTRRQQPSHRRRSSSPHPAFRDLCTKPFHSLQDKDTTPDSMVPVASSPLHEPGDTGDNRCNADDTEQHLPGNQPSARTVPPVHDRRRRHPNRSERAANGQQPRSPRVNEIAGTPRTIDQRQRSIFRCSDDVGTDRRGNQSKNRGNPRHSVGTGINVMDSGRMCRSSNHRYLLQLTVNRIPWPHRRQG